MNGMPPIIEATMQMIQNMHQSSASSNFQATSMPPLSMNQNMPPPSHTQLSTNQAQLMQNMGSGFLTSSGSPFQFSNPVQNVQGSPVKDNSAMTYPLPMQQDMTNLSYSPSMPDYKVQSGPPPMPPTSMEAGGTGGPPPPLGPCAVKAGPKLTIDPQAKGSQDENIYKNSALDRIRYALEQNVHSDCSFCVGPQENSKIISGHKAILAFASKTFTDLLFGPAAQVGNKPISVPDVDPLAFDSMLKFIYTDQVQLNNPEEARHLCYASTKYLLPHLTTKCLEYLGNTLTASNVCELYEFGKQVEAKPFEERCLQVMREATQAILAQPDFLKIKQGTLEALLQQNTLAVKSEIDLISAAMAWAREEARRRGLNKDDIMCLRQVLGPALPRLRFLSLTPEEFAKNVAPCGLFSIEEAHYILLRLLGNESVILPNEFGDDCRRRQFLTSPQIVSTEQVCSCPTGLRDLALLTHADPLSRTKESRVTMRCDRDIKLHGLQIGAQVNYPMALQAFSSSFMLQEFLNKTYIEELWVQLVVTEYRLGRFKRWTAEDITVNKEVSFNSMIELRFQEPISVKRYDQVELRISYFKEGIYPKGAWQSQAPCGVANFTFESANPNHECVLNFISSIVFTMEP